MLAIKKRVLIVDDSTFIRIGLRHFLETQDYEVQEAADTEEALRLFEQHQPGIIILDISLQIGPDGREGLCLARKIKERRSSVGVILLSGSASHYQEFLDISRKYRGIAYLYKGNDVKDHLLAVIEQVQKGGVWVAPEIAGYEENSVVVPLTQAEKEALRNILNHFDELTEKEIEIVQLVATSCENKDIAERQNISLNTVSAHMTHIYSKLGLEDEWSKNEKRSLLTKAYWLIRSKKGERNPQSS